MVHHAIGTRNGGFRHRLEGRRQTAGDRRQETDGSRQTAAGSIRDRQHSDSSSMTKGTNVFLVQLSAVHFTLTQLPPSPCCLAYRLRVPSPAASWRLPPVACLPAPAACLPPPAFYRLPLWLRPFALAVAAKRE
jgi:hypothetical protein